MKNQKNILILILLMLVSFFSKSQCYILFEEKVIETPNDMLHINGLTGKIVNGGHFGNFDENAISYIEFVNVEKDSLTIISNSIIDSLQNVNNLTFDKYRIQKIIGYEVNNKIPYIFMKGLYSTDIVEFYTTIYTVGKYNTRNNKPYPFKILPLTEQIFILKYFNITKKEADIIWNQIKNQLD